MTYTKELMTESLAEMYKNLNYYYKITSPMHGHKTYDKQIEQTVMVAKNMTHLSEDLDQTKQQLDHIEKDLYKRADDSFKRDD